MTSVRSTRGRYIHATHDLRKTYCNKKCDGWFVEPDQKATCPTCHTMTTTN